MFYRELDRPGWMQRLKGGQSLGDWAGGWDDVRRVEQRGLGGDAGRWQN